MLFTVTTADAAVAAGDYFNFCQKIEGLNCADLDFGKSTAQNVMLSFRVRSSLVGTYCGSLMNSAANRSLTFEYTIIAANVWESKTVSLVGDTTGTWLVDTGIGMRVFFTLMAGTTFQQAPTAWGTSGNALATTNQVNWLGTLGNTFYITGVKLEAGSSATAWQYLPYGTKIGLCQRYYNGFLQVGVGLASGTSNYAGTVLFPVPMRIAPATITLSGSAVIANGATTFAQTGTTVSMAASTVSATPNLSGFSAALTANAIYIWNDLTKFLRVSAEL